VRRMLERTIEVAAGPGEAWDHLIEPARWPSWARHIRRVEMDPPGRAQLGSRGRVRLRNGTSARQVVVVLDEGRRWRWDGTFLWLRLAYDHVVEPRPGGGSTVTFTVDGGGRGAGSIGKAFAWIYARNLDRALPALQQELGGPPKA
jgi:hypothetical protein